MPGEVVPEMRGVEGTAWMSKTIPPIITASPSRSPPSPDSNLPPFNGTLNSVLTRGKKNQGPLADQSHPLKQANGNWRREVRTCRIITWRRTAVPASHWCIRWRLRDWSLRWALSSPIFWLSNSPSGRDACYQSPENKTKASLSLSWLHGRRSLTFPNWADGVTRCRPIKSLLDWWSEHKWAQICRATRHPDRSIDAPTGIVI